jgi:hypothetical protein
MFAAVATLLAVMALRLKQSSQDTSTSYPNNPRQPLADSNTHIPCELPPLPSPTSVAFSVNTPLFMSLTIHFTCVFLAMLLYQWTRWCLGFTQLRDSHCKRARSFLSHDVENFYVSLVVTALPKPLRRFLPVFIIGLFVGLCSFDRTFFRLVVLWSAIHVVATCAIGRRPLTNLGKLWRRVTLVTWLTCHKFPDSFPAGKLHTILGFLSFSFGDSPRSDDLRSHHHNLSLDGKEDTAEKCAWQQPSKPNVHILGQTLDALEEDGAWEESFKAITDLFDSGEVNGIEGHILDELRIKFRGALNGFLETSFSSNLVTEPVRSSRLITCLNATHAVLGTDGVSQILYDILNGRWPELLQSVETAHSLRRWGNNTDKRSTDYVRRIVTHVVFGVQKRDAGWIALAKAEFGIQDHVLPDIIEYGDSALFSLFIHITRQAFHYGSSTPFILASFSRLEIRNTRPELQHEFCSLWNEIVREAWRVGTDSAALSILREIRQAFIELHQDTAAASTAFSASTNHYNPVLTQPLSYRFCNIPSHRPNPTSPSPAVNHITIHPLTRAGLGSSLASTAQLGGPPSHSLPPPLSKIQHSPGNTSVPWEANVVHASTQQSEEVNIKGYDV